MYYPDPHVDTLLQDLLADESTRLNTRIILIGEHATIDVEELIRKANAANLHFLGGIFPGIIFEKEST
ncbi:MAG: hypothetical protein AAFU60_13470, partial [Bacteroidota bacterium]